MITTDSSSPIEPIICLAQKFEAIGNKYIFQPMGLSSISMKILKLLKEKSSLTTGELLKMTSTNKSNLSQRLSYLEKEKLISKLPAHNNKDKRKLFIELTPKGKEKIDDFEKRLRKAKISFEKKFTKKELSAHKAFFEKLNYILDNGETELEKIFKN